MPFRFPFGFPFYNNYNRYHPYNKPSYFPNVNDFQISNNSNNVGTSHSINNIQNNTSFVHNPKNVEIETDFAQKKDSVAREPAESFLDNRKTDKSFFNSQQTDEAFFEIFGLKLYFDDILIIALLFLLYNEKVKDTELFVCLTLLLLD